MTDTRTNCPHCGIPVTGKHDSDEYDPTDDFGLDMHQSSWGSLASMAILFVLFLGAAGYWDRLSLPDFALDRTGFAIVLSLAIIAGIAIQKIVAVRPARRAERGD